MKSLSICTLVLFICSAAYGQTQPASGKNVDAREVIRRGDLVEHVTDDINDNEPMTRTWAQIAATPVNDIDKWFISVVSKKDCPACDQLKEQWKTNPILRAYAMPDNAKDSWAHYTVYDYNDRMESWRWQSVANPRGIKIEAFPTIIVQPPRSGAYGKPNIVVFKYIYEGDPVAFKQGMNSSIKAYIQKLQEQPRRETTTPKETVAPVEPAVTDNTSIGSKGFEAFEPDPLHSEQELDQAASTLVGYGQQQIPPLNLPNDDEQVGPLRNTIQSLGRGSSEILVVRDPTVERTPEEQKSIDHAVEHLKGQSDQKLRVRYVDVNKVGKQYGVTPDECPVVLQTSGKTVSQKLSALQSLESRTTPNFAWWVLSDWLTGGTITEVIWFMLKVFVFFAFVLFLIALLVIMSRRSAPPTTVVQGAPAAQPQLDYDVLAAKIIAAQSTAEVAKKA